jgi:hypothetical protein
MKKIIFTLLLMTNTAYADQLGITSTVNNATVNIQGNYQNVTINQSGIGYHTAIVSTVGDFIPVIINQSGSTNKSVSVDITCVSNCSTNPTVVNQF